MKWGSQLWFPSTSPASRGSAVLFSVKMFLTPTHFKCSWSKLYAYLWYCNFWIGFWTFYKGYFATYILLTSGLLRGNRGWEFPFHCIADATQTRPFFFNFPIGTISLTVHYHWQKTPNSFVLSSCSEPQKEIQGFLTHYTKYKNLWTNTEIQQ